ncbi:hypothetical protein [Ottowia sp.]|uniref:hypothetical protein n=1 Tax=Ottowia sp. TaxID=1898956 RepID=UPI0026007287|nr:hypothetical protein [Ottowia sp.]MBK6616619.1 hypothetical protein [Ottowia sp.]
MKPNTGADQAVGSIETRRLLFALAAFLPMIGRGDLVPKIEVEGISETEFVVWLKSEGIGVDVGYDIKVPSIGRTIIRQGFRVFTMEVAPGSRISPPEDVDVTKAETFYPDEVLVHVATLLATLAVNAIPPLPAELAPAEAVMEEV